MAISLLPHGIRIPTPSRERMESLLHTIEESYPEPINVAFASESLRENQSSDRRYDAVWIFTDHYIGEIKNPLGPAEGMSGYDITLLAHRVDWIRLTRKAYDLKNATDKSQLVIEFSTTDSVSGTISSAGLGCDDLMQVYMKHFRPNFINH